MIKIIIINGPNLNLLGEREQTQYGSNDYKYLKEICLNRAKDLNIDIEIRQSNVEGDIVNFIQELESQGIFKDKIVTEVNDIQKFFVAENYHHDYFTKNPENAYCQAVINPKLNKLRSLFSELISE